MVWESVRYHFMHSHKDPKPYAIVINFLSCENPTSNETIAVTAGLGDIIMTALRSLISRCLCCLRYSNWVVKLAERIR